MKSDTQHLEFLISQYVDGTLDAPSRKTIEQQLLTDPVARKLYQQQQETQDVLDDFGSRLPMINWSEFEATLAERLEKEAPASRPRFYWKTWIKPAAVAAGLFLAVGIGYFMRAMEVPTSHTNIVEVPTKNVMPDRSVAIEIPVSRVAARSSVDYTGNLPQRGKAFGKVDVGEDPVMAINRVVEEGALKNWSIGRDHSAGNWLSQEPPRVIHASGTQPSQQENGIQ